MLDCDHIPACALRRVEAWESEVDHQADVSYTSLYLAVGADFKARWIKKEKMVKPRGSVRPFVTGEFKMQNKDIKKNVRPRGNVRPFITGLV